MTHHPTARATGRPSTEAQTSRVNKQRLSVICWSALVLIGVANASIGTTVQQLIDRFGLSLSAAGLIPLMMGGGRLATVLLSGGLSDVFGRKPILVAGTVVMAAGALSYALSPWWWLCLAGALAIGAGIGLLDTGANSLTADLNPDSRRAAMNYLHAFFGIGCIAGPLVTAALIHSGASWPMTYIATAVGLALLAPVAASQAFPATFSGKSAQRGILSHPDILRSREFRALALISFLYTGMSTTIISWVNKLLDLSDVSIVTSLGVAALYNLGVTVGRFASGRYSRRFTYRSILLVCSVGSLAATLVGMIATDLVIISAGLTLAGFFMASLLPTAIAFSSELFTHKVGASTGLLFACAAAGGMVVPFATGVLSDIIGLKLGMVVAGLLGTFLVTASASLGGEARTDAKRAAAGC